MTIIRYGLALLLSGVLLLSLIGFLGDWPADMVTPFRLQFLLIGMAGLCIALPSRHMWLTGLAALVIMGNAIPMATRLFERPVLARQANGRGVSLVFSNVLCDNRQFDRVTRLARAQDADIFAAAETTGDWVDHLDSLSDLYPYRFAPKNLGPFGIALYAKQPFSAEVMPTGSRGMQLLRADFGDRIVYVVHTMPPANPVLSADNRVYLETVAARVASETKPVIVVGDFNATLWSHNMQPMIQAGLQWPAGSGVRYSWPTQRPWFAIQIDQVLTRGAKAGTYRTLGDVGSDHYPVRADLVF